jgi:hypothetical protein
MTAAELDRDVLEEGLGPELNREVGCDEHGRLGYR